MTPKQEQQVRDEVASLIAETQGFHDAAQYIGDIAADVGVRHDEVYAELKRQCGVHPSE